jgi:hypothetical protein
MEWCMSYDNLGDKSECGPDLVRHRAYLKRKPWLMNQVPKDPNGNVPREVERALYNDFLDTFTFNHTMKLSDNTPWGGSETFVVEMLVSSHAQCRMDMRCVPYAELRSVITSTFAEMERAWVSGDATAYQAIASQLFYGTTGTQKGIGGMGGVRIPLALGGGKAKTHKEPLGGVAVDAPSTSSVSLVAKSVVAIGRAKKTKHELKQDECVIMLTDMDYNVVRKKAHKYASSDSLRFTIEGGQWLGGFGIRDMKHEMLVNLNLEPQKEKIEYLSADLRELKKSFAEWVKDNLIKNAKKDRIDTYLKQFHALLEGSIEIEADDGVIYTIKRDTKEQGTLYPAVLIAKHLDEGYDVKVPSSSRYGTMEFYFEVTKVKGDASKEAELEEKRKNVKIKDCLDALEDDYIVYDPSGNRVV